jgi:hypothetical protein
MKSLIEWRETDDPDLIDLFNLLVAGLLTRNCPEEFYLVEIDNWFDHKWLGYSGNGAAKSPFPYLGGRLGDLIPSVKVEVRNDKLNLPPFNPNRILEQRCFAREGHAYEEAPLRPPHKFNKQHSESNLHHRLEDLYSSATFVWYSSNTIANDRASLMAYTSKSDQIEAWYSSFLRKDGWKINAAKGIAQGALDTLINEGRDLFAPLSPPR